MESTLGTVPVFIGVTLVLAGYCAFATGQALAQTWRPITQVIPYCLLLGAGDRFLKFALFDGQLLSGTGYLIDTAILLVVGLISYKITQAAKMVSQYPWQYDRSGLFGWKEKHH